MNHGSGWIVWEESSNSNRRLLSILPARRNRDEVAHFVQQLYVDRFASIDEKLEFKKHPNSSRFPMLADHYPGPKSVGFGPWYFAVYAREIVLEKNQLSFYYRIAVNRADPYRPVFEERRQTIDVSPTRWT